MMGRAGGDGGRLWFLRSRSLVKKKMKSIRGRKYGEISMVNQSKLHYSEIFLYVS